MKYTIDCAEKFINDNPGWIIYNNEDDEDNGYVTLLYNHNTIHAPIISGHMCDVSIGLHLDSIIKNITAYTLVKEIDSCKYVDFTHSVDLLKEIIPIIDDSLNSIGTYFHDEFKVNTFSAITFPNGNSNYFQYAAPIINIQNKFGDTELIKLVKNIYYSSETYIKDAIIQLIDYGADPDICNKNGESARGILIEYGENAILAYIEKIELEKILLTGVITSDESHENSLKI